MPNIYYMDKGVMKLLCSK